MNYPHSRSARKSNLLRFVICLVAPLLASCAAPVTDSQLHGKKEDLEVYISIGLRPLSVFQLMRSGDEVWLTGPVKRPVTEGREPRLLYSGDVEPQLLVVARAYNSGAVSIATINELDDVYARVAGIVPLHDAEDSYVSFLEIGKGVFRLRGGKYGPLVFSLSGNWVFRVPVRDSFRAVLAFNAIHEDIAFADCGDYPKEDNSCTVSIFHLETRSTEPLMELVGNVEDMKFSCDGKKLYILMREFSIKSGPIDSLFALAGHPNSDNYYRLVIFSMRDRSETVLDVKGEYSPGDGYLVSDCSEMG